MATYNLRRNVKSFRDCNYNFNILNWLLINLDNINVDGKTLTVKAANVKGTLTAEQIIVGATTNFEAGYDPSTKATSSDVDAAKTYADQRAGEVQAIAENIANGAYSGTFIDGRHIYSPIISGQDAYFEGTIDIGNGNFTVDSTGWIKGAKGGFSVPPTADGVFNNYSGAARWKYSDDNYIYQDSSEFRIYLDGAKFVVQSDGSAYVVESGDYKQIATRSWVQENATARFG